MKKVHKTKTMCQTREVERQTSIEDFDTLYWCHPIPGFWTSMAVVTGSTIHLQFLFNILTPHIWIYEAT